MWPVGTQRSISAGIASLSERPAELVSSIVLRPGMFNSSTIAAASASVLTSGVCSFDSGSMQ
jgi:hypothetical protein